MTNSKSIFLNGNVLNIIQAPIALGQTLNGVEQGPDILIQNGLIEQINDLGWTIGKNSKLLKKM